MFREDPLREQVPQKRAHGWEKHTWARHVSILSPGQCDVDFLLSEKFLDPAIKIGARGEPDEEITEFLGSKHPSQLPEEVEHLLEKNVESESHAPW